MAKIKTSFMDVLLQNISSSTAKTGGLFPSDLVGRRFKIISSLVPLSFLCWLKETKTLNEILQI